MPQGTEITFKEPTLGLKVMATNVTLLGQLGPTHTAEGIVTLEDTSVFGRPLVSDLKERLS